MNTTLFSAITLAGLASSASAAHIWINEFHYDNTDGDVGEFVEIALSTPNASGFAPSDYSVLLYNGNNSSVYNTLADLSTADIISAPIPIAGSTDTITLYTFTLPANGLQNGSPDGIALVNSTNGGVESFLSYEGTFTASGGTADGVLSIDVGVEESGQELGTSLSASGTGINADNFDASSFALTSATPGAINQRTNLCSS